MLSRFLLRVGNGFSLEERKRFVDFIKNGNSEAKQHMLAGALNDLVITHTNERAHLAGQTIDLGSLIYA